MCIRDSLYRVIYDAIADVEAAMKGMLDPVYEEKVIGHAEVRQTFKASGVGTIAGSYVLDGTFQRGCKVRITREGKQIYEGALASLKRFKDDVKAVSYTHLSTGVCSEPVFRFSDSRDISAVSDSGSHKMYDRIYSCLLYTSCPPGACPPERITPTTCFLVTEVFWPFWKVISFFP